MPSSQPQEEARNVPEHYRRHWERVPEMLRSFPLRTKNNKSVCMTPTREHEGKMFSESKCFSLMRKDSLDLLSGPQSGVTYCFVGETTTEIPLHIQEAIFFFNSCSNKYQTQDRSPFVFPTKDIGLQESGKCRAFLSRCAKGLTCNDFCRRLTGPTRRR
jgi:hypothetical protein